MRCKKNSTPHSFSLLHRYQSNAAATKAMVAPKLTATGGLKVSRRKPMSRKRPGISSLAIDPKPSPRRT